MYSLVDNVTSTLRFMKFFDSKSSSNAVHPRNFLKDCKGAVRRMGNAGSGQTSRPRKERKKEENNRVDGRPSKNKKVASNSRATVKELNKYKTTNPFIIFFLRLRSKKPKEHVTVIARAAGKLWTQMTPEQRKKYVDLANAERKRREEKRRRRKIRRKK